MHYNRAFAEHTEKSFDLEKVIHCSFCLKMLLLILLFLKISFLVLWNDVNFQTESIVTDFWRELENVLYSSLDSYAYSLKLSISNPGIERVL